MHGPLTGFHGMHDTPFPHLDWFDDRLCPVLVSFRYTEEDAASFKGGVVPPPLSGVVLRWRAAMTEDVELSVRAYNEGQGASALCREGDPLFTVE